MNNFYVYMYLDQNNIPFYIGKGRNNRYLLSKHFHSSHRFLKNKINKIGIDNIQTKFLYKDLTEEQAFYLEEYYIAGLGRRNLCLGPLVNLTNGGNGASGYSQTEQHKRKLSIALKGNQNSLGCSPSIETKTKISKSLMGNQHTLGVIPSIETRAKMAIARKGRQPNLGHRHSEEAKRKMAEGHKGKIFSNEHKQKLSIARQGKTPTLGHKYSEMTKKKMSLILIGNKRALGHQHSDETKLKISEGNKLYWLNKKNNQ